MKLTVLTAIVLVVITLEYSNGLDRNARGPWGQQYVKLDKTGRKTGSIDTKQTGTRRKVDLEADARSASDITAKSGRKNWKTGTVSGKKVGVGRRRKTENIAEVVNKDLNAKGSRGNAKVDTTGRTKANLNAKGRRGNKNLYTEYTDNSIGAVVKAKKKKNSRQPDYVAKLDKDGRKSAKIYKSRNQVGTVDINSRDNIDIEFQNPRKGMQKMETGSSGDRYATDNKFKGVGQNWKAKTQKGSTTRTEIGPGGFAGRLLGGAYTEVDSPRERVNMGGTIVKTQVRLQNKGEKDQLCPGNYPWGDQFQIDKRGVNVMGRVNRRGNKLDAKWPQCMDLEVPMTLPPGTKVENLAIALEVFIPGCNQVICRGYVCGISPEVGLASENCWFDDLCKFKPPKPSERSKSLGVILTNTDTNACKNGLRGNRLNLKYTICPFKNERMQKDKPCGFINLKEFSGQKNQKKGKVMVITKVYEKKGGGSSSPFGRGGFNLGKIVSQTLTQCKKNDYRAVACREMFVDYTMSAFGLSDSTHDMAQAFGVPRWGKTKYGNDCVLHEHSSGGFYVFTIKKRTASRHRVLKFPPFTGTPTVDSNLQSFAAYVENQWLRDQDIVELLLRIKWAKKGFSRNSGGQRSTNTNTRPSETRSTNRNTNRNTNSNRNSNGNNIWNKFWGNNNGGGNTNPAPSTNNRWPWG